MIQDISSYSDYIYTTIAIGELFSSKNYILQLNLSRNSLDKYTIARVIAIRRVNQDINRLTIVNEPGYFVGTL